MTFEEFNERIQQILRMDSNKEAFFKLCDVYMIASAQQREEIRQNYFVYKGWEVDRAFLESLGIS